MFILFVSVAQSLVAIITPTYYNSCPRLQISSSLPQPNGEENYQRFSFFFTSAAGAA
jgi:hypothetical protein